MATGKRRRMRMGFPNYSREMRERAKKNGEWLVTVDLVMPDGKRNVCAQQLFSREQALTVYNALQLAMRDRHASAAKGT